MESQLIEIDSAINCRFPRAKKAESRIFQFVDSVRDFSSHYGNDAGISYTVYNVIGRPSIFPKLGDDARAFLMRTYGPWWKNIPSAEHVKLNTVIPQDCAVLSQDFIEVQYKKPVYPCELHIYETYNPGALVKVLCYHYEVNKWEVLWSDKPRIKKLNGSKAFLATMVRLKWVNFKTDLYRLEFYHQHLHYYCELDAIELGGYENEPSDELYNDNNKINTSLNDIIIEPNKDITNFNEVFSNCNFDKMPIEVLRLIFSCLDLETLCIAAKVSRLFKNLCYDPVLYSVLNLQPFWHKVTASTLRGLQSRCTSLEKLSLAWCGDHHRITSKDFVEFVEKNCQYLTCLILSNCHFVDNQSLKAIAKSCPHLQVFDMSSCDNKRLCPVGFSQILQLKHLTYLNLSHTNVDDQILLLIVRLCSKLEHLFIGGCKNLHNCNEIVKEISIHLRNLKTLELFRLKSIGSEAINDLSENCKNLVELDLGWCSNIDVNSGCLQNLIRNCIQLKKFYVSAIRLTSDNELNLIAECLRDLEQLDILGSFFSTTEGIEEVLKCCQKLKFLDISYCNKINQETADFLRSTYPHVQIKKACPLQP